MAAVVALQAAGQAVLDQPGGAVGALQTMAAGAAERERGVAAPVEKQQNLLAGNQGLADGLAQRRRQPAGAEAPQPRRRSEERRAGKGWGRTWRCRWAP